MVFHFPPISGGGVIVVSKIANALAELGHEITIITPDIEWNGEKYNPKLHHNIEVIRTETPSKNNIKIAARRCYKNLRDKGIELGKEKSYDFIFSIFHPFHFAPKAAVSCAKKLNIPFYLSLHTQYDYNRKLVKKRNLKKFFALKYTEKFIEPFVLENADKITIVFKIIESYVKKHSDKKPELLYNKIDFNRFANATSKEELKKPLILSVGNLIETKKHKLILEAMKSIEANCLIIGNGELFDHLKQFIKKNHLEDLVIIKQPMEHNEICYYYNIASVLLIFSKILFFKSLEL